MPIPEITHLQFLVLTTLLDGEESGQQLRDKLLASGVRKTGPAFYQLMARLEDAGLVKGKYQQRVIDNQVVKERRYKLTAPGTRTWQQTRDFYFDHAAKVGLGKVVYA